jgi:hypothetical protein
VVTNGG